MAKFDWRNIGINVARLRKARNMTQETLAEKAGLQRETVSRIENGLRCPRTCTVQKLAAALQCDPNALYTDFQFPRL